MNVLHRNAAHCAYTVVKEEGVSSLYRGVSLTALRQATNQGELDSLPQLRLRQGSDRSPIRCIDATGVNFTAYQEFKRLALKYQPQYADTELPSWQTMILGLVSGAMGPFSNAPIDTIKT
jgi:solute carrier family 25 citrate transporter 1